MTHWHINQRNNGGDPMEVLTDLHGDCAERSFMMLGDTLSTMGFKVTETQAFPNGTQTAIYTLTGLDFVANAVVTSVVSFTMWKCGCSDGERVAEIQEGSVRLPSIVSLN